MATHPYTRLFADKTASPTSSDDSGDGYEQGDVWIYPTLPGAWIAIDVSPGSAVWHKWQGDAASLASLIAGASLVTTLADLDKFVLRKNSDGSLEGITWAGMQGILIPSNGWSPRSETWTRTGNHTFTASGDLTAILRKGVKIRYKDGGSYEHGVIGSSSHAAGTTTINLIVNTNYSMAAATITDRYISLIENPEGWPHFFDYTPTFSRSGTPFTNAPTVNKAHFKAQGDTIIGFIDFTIPASPGGTGEVYASAPVTIVTNRVDMGVEVAVTALPCMAIAQSSINSLNFYTFAPAPITITAGYRYQVNFKYLF